jgi:cell division protein FtsW (lipid II flippase)
MSPARRRSQTGLILAAAVIVMAGFATALVAMLIDMHRWPKASIWAVVGVTVLLVTIIRTVSTRKP